MTINKELLTEAFEKLGPERVAAGLTGHRIEPLMNSFYACFLACAFGRPGELLAYINGPHTEGLSAPAMMGLTGVEFEHIWMNVDMCHDEFWALANEWLENRPASPRARTQETAVASQGGRTYDPN